MLIGICGGICAGKNSVQDYLISRHGFKPLKLQRTTATPSIEKSASEASVPAPDGTDAEEFANVGDLLEFATKHWQTNYVTTSIHDEAVVDKLSGRPFFILIHIDAPISVRWQRFKDRCAEASLTPPDLEQFVLRNDAHQYSPSTGLAALASRAQIKLLNSTISLEKLHLALDGLNLTDSSRMRPTWDHYFMTLASLAARRSNCMRRQVGCVLVREKRVMATGYNGTPRNVTNCNEGGCPRCNAGGTGGTSLSTCLCIHAEENALLEAGRERVGGGAVLYCNTCPCLTCSIKIVQVGITEVVFNQTYYMDTEAANIFKEAGVKLRQFSPPKEGLVNSVDGITVEPEVDGNGNVYKSMSEKAPKQNGTVPAGEKQSSATPQAGPSSGKAKFNGPTGKAKHISDPQLRDLLIKVQTQLDKSLSAKTQSLLDAERARRAVEGHQAVEGSPSPSSPDSLASYTTAPQDPGKAVRFAPEAMLHTWDTLDRREIIDLTDASPPQQQAQPPPSPQGPPRPGFFAQYISPSLSSPVQPRPAPQSIPAEAPAPPVGSTQKTRPVSGHVQRHALTENRTAVNGTVAKRPARDGLKPAKRQRQNHQTTLHGKVVDMHVPLACVSKIAKKVYERMEYAKANEYAQQLGLDSIVAKLTLAHHYVRPAVKELLELGLLVPTCEGLEWCASVPLGVWREQQDDIYEGRM